MIFCQNKIYGKVWKVTKSQKYIDLRISTSEKPQDREERIYSTWFPRAIGHAFNSLKDVKEGDTIIITRSKLSNETYEDKEGNKKSSFKFLILEASIQSQEEANGSDEKEAAAEPNKSAKSPQTPPPAKPIVEEEEPW